MKIYWPVSAYISTKQEGALHTSTPHAFKSKNCHMDDCHMDAEKF